MKTNNKKRDWKKLETSKRELIQKEIKLLFKKIKKIEEGSFPKNIRDKLNSLNSYKIKYDEQLIINSRLISSLEEYKINRIKDENIFKLKAKILVQKLN